MDDPNSSRPAKYISMFVMLIIALSVINFIVGTEITPRCGWLSYGSAPDDVAYECGDGKLSDTGVSAEVLNALETICIMVFTVEYVLRILTCTTSMSLVSFIFAPMNVIDLVAILPYYLDLILAAARQHGENAPSLGSARARLELGSCASSTLFCRMSCLYRNERPALCCLLRPWPQGTL